MKYVLLLLGLLFVTACTQVVSNDELQNTDDVIGTICTQSQKEATICTMEYNPTCGYDRDGNALDTFGNVCGACSTDEVYSYEIGYCDSETFCTEQYDPVCATLTDGSQKTFSNNCYAQKETEVVDISPGACMISCTQEQIDSQGEPVMCTREYNPVCGFDSEGDVIDSFSNPCVACNAQGVVNYQQGEC